HGERYLSVRCTECDSGSKIIDHLGGDACPIDRINARKPYAITEGMVIKHGLHERLTIVERAFYSKRMDVRVRHGGHHPPLHVGDAPLWEKNHHICLRTTTEGFDGRGASIAGCRNNDGGAFTALLQHMVHQPRHKLHR